MLNKDRLLNHIKDDELRLKLIKSLNVVDGVIANHDIRVTDFLNPYELKAFLAVLRGIEKVGFCVCNEIVGAERKVVYIHPDYMETDHVDSRIGCILLRGNFKFRTLSHRDYLGALLGLGIVREKVGDIFVHEDRAYMVLADTIVDFVMFNLTKVGSLKVTLEQVSPEEVIYVEPEFKAVSFTMASLRIDALVAGLFGVSRSVASMLIANEKVAVDYEVIKNSAKHLVGGELISVRGFGRGRYMGIEYTTKKDRLKVSGKVYL